jgi:hypothetical protein
MKKETIKYNDFNGNEREEDFYFNLTKAELMKMELGVKGGFAEAVKRIIAAQDQPALIEIFEDLIKKSYGVKTPDGRGFRKTKEDLDDFMATEAYSNLFMKLATDAQAASDFINGVVPADMAQQAAASGLMPAIN